MDNQFLDQSSFYTSHLNFFTSSLALLVAAPLSIVAALPASLFLL